MLFFEFFPLFVAFVGVVAAVLLYVKDRSARANNEPEDPITPRDPSRKDDEAGPVCAPHAGLVGRAVQLGHNARCGGTVD